MAGRHSEVATPDEVKQAFPDVNEGGAKDPRADYRPHSRARAPGLSMKTAYDLDRLTQRTIRSLGRRDGVIS